MSQQRLSRESGIDPATVSIIIGNLEAAGIVRREADAPTGRAGRPTSALTIDSRAGYLAGIGIEPDAIRIGLATIDGAFCADITVPGSIDPAAAQEATSHGITEALRAVKAKRSALLGIGIALPGLVTLDGRIVFAPNLGWRDIDFADALIARLKCPIRLENDVKAAALAEHLFGASRDIPDFIYLMGRSGLGGGLYLMGELYRGPHGLAGEVGHMKIVPDGRLCGCGGHGCLEAYASERAILAELAARGHPARDVEAVLAAGHAGDAVVHAVLDEAGRYLGLGLANLINVLSPRRIVLGGSIALLAPFLMPPARLALARNALGAISRDVELVVSAIGERAPVMGGVALALQQFLADPPVRLGHARDAGSPR